MVSQTAHKSNPNKPPAAGGKSLKSFPLPPRSALDDSEDSNDSADDEDVGLTVSEGDDSDNDENDIDNKKNSNDNDSKTGDENQNDAANHENEDENEDEDENDNEDARIKALADDEPDLSFLGNDRGSESLPGANSNAIATTSEEDGDEEGDVDADDNALDDSSIEEEEEAAIRAELSRKSRRRSIPGPVSLRRLSQSQQTRRQSRENSENSGASDSSDSDDTSSSSSSSSWGNEYLEDYFDQPMRPSNPTKPHRKGGRYAGDSDADSQSENESHLWQYFFSSEEGDDDFASQFEHDDGRTESSKRTNGKPRPLTAPKDGEAADNDGGASTDEDLPLKGRGPLPPPQNANPSGYIPSGDSTDEDDGVPPERKRRRARGTKAIEVLGSDSFSTRPPVLGSWRIKGDKNVGIIDGLTTRTLSPPPPVRHDHLSHYDGSPRNLGTPVRGGEPVDPFENLGDTPQDSVAGIFAEIGDSSFDLGSGVAQAEHGADPQHYFDDVEVSDLDLLELGDYINTNGMSSDDNDDQLPDNLEFELDFDADHLHHPQQHNQQHQTLQHTQPRQFRSPAVSPYIYRSRFPSRSVPISAFRNRGSPYVHNPAYPSENPSPAPRRMRGSSVSGRRPSVARDAFMSPARQTRKRVKKARPGAGPRSALAGQHHAPPSSSGHTSFEDGTHDLLGELIEIGAISPLFDINQ